MPAFAFAMIGISGACAARPSTVRSRSGAPTPQFAPNAIGGLSSPAAADARSAAPTPIIVRPAVSKLMVPHQGAPARRNASAAAANSSSEEMVSTHSRSAPPSISPSACSWKISTASSRVSAPTGAMISPVGPTQPATATGRSAASATSRPISADILESSRARRSAPCSFSRAALPPKELVRNRSAPASTAER